MARLLRSLRAVVLAVALFAAPATVAVPKSCARCADDCPMHRRRLPCHDEGARMPCHTQGGPRLVSASCGHGDGATLLEGLRALLPARSEARFDLVVSRRLPEPQPLVPAPVLEPPIRPPRLSLVLA